VAQTVKRGNLTIGRADLYVSPAGTDDPITIDEDPGAEWRGAGYTDSPATATITSEHAEARPQQTTVTVRRVRTSLAGTVTVALAERSLDNLKLALSGTATVTATEAAVDLPASERLELAHNGQLEEMSLLIDAPQGGPGSSPRRVYMPLVVVTSDLKLSQDRDEFGNIEVTFEMLDDGAGSLFTVTDKTGDALPPA